MNFSRRVICCLLAAGIGLFGGCRKSGESSATPPQSTSAPAASAPAPTGPPERHHRMFTSGVSPLIVSMSPETLTVRDGHAPMARYSLTYEITNSEKVSKAYISVRAVGVGEVQRFDVDVQPRATIEFLLDASNVDLGPTVRLRARCGGNDTDWFYMGGDAQEPLPNSSSPQISDVSPNYVQAGGQGAVPVEIWGSQLTKDCTPEAQVDGTSVELKNVAVINKAIHAQLSYSDLQGRPVVTRHLEVNLVVNGPGMPAEDTYELKFVE